MTPTTRLSAWAARPGRLPAVAASSVAAALVASTLLTAPAGVAQEPDGGVRTVRILLDEVDPVVLRPGEPVTLRGRLVNDGPVPSRLTSLTVAAAPTPLGSRAEVAGWVGGEDARAASWVLGDDALGTVVPSGGQSRFEITVPASSLEALPPSPSVLGVELVAAAGAEEDRVPTPGTPGPGVLRTVLTSTGPAPVEVPLETAWVVPLTLPADADLVSPDDTLHAAAWLAAVGADSAVRGWLDHLTVPDVTWVVDPAVLVAHRPASGIAVPAAVEEPDEPEDPEDPEDPDDAEVTEDLTEDPGEGQRTTAPGAQTARPTGAEQGLSGGATVGEGAGRTAAPDDTATTTGPVPVPTPSPEPEPEPDPGPEGLDEAVDHLRETLGSTDPEQRWWLPTDDPDLAVLADADTRPTSEIVTDLLSRRPPGAPPEVTRLLREGRHDVAWPALAAPLDADVTGIAELFARRGPDPGLGAVLVPRESFTADSAVSPRLGAVPLREHPGVLAIGADSWTSALVADSGPVSEESGAGAAVQGVLAHTLGTWLEAPASPRTLVIAPPRGTDVPPAVLDQLSEAWQDARWLEPVAAEELLARAVDHEPVRLSGVGPQEQILGPLAGLMTPPGSPLTSARARNLGELREDLDGLAEVLLDTDALRSWQPVLSGLWSTRGRADDELWLSTWRAVRHEVRTTRQGIYLLPSNVNFLADQGVIQVTVVNDLPVAVEDVRLILRPDNGLLQVIGEPEPAAVGPGSRASVPFEARAITRGETVLSVRITTPNGTSLGQEAQVAVRVQPTGVWIYWVLGGLAGLVLVLGLRRALHSSPRVPRSADRSGPAYPGTSPSPGQETST